MPRGAAESLSLNMLLYMVLIGFSVIFRQCSLRRCLQTQPFSVPVKQYNEGYYGQFLH